MNSGILTILNEIGANSARTYKINVITKHKDNELFKRTLFLTLDPYTNFFIRKIPEYKATGAKNLDWALVELEKLSNRQLTGHAGIEHLRNILSNLISDDAIVVERIIGKDLRVSAADGTVNEAIKDFIPTYPCLLARPYEAKNIKNIVYPAYSQLKADGVRVNIHVNGSGITFCGRSGKVMDLLNTLDSDFEQLGTNFSTPVVFDGELVVMGPDSKLLSRKVGNGIINKAIKGTMSAEEAKMVRVQLWDVIPADEFKARKSKEEYTDRFNKLIAAIKTETDKITPGDRTAAALKGTGFTYWVIPWRMVNNLEEAQEHFEEMLSIKEEGTILKNGCAFWEDTRSKHLVKLKSEKDCDLEVIGWTEGKGKFVGMVGSLLCASSDGLVETNLSGFTDDVRKDITVRIKEIMGTIVAVLYNERISDKSRPGVDSLFLPRYAEFRYDKSIANSSKEIK